MADDDRNRRKRGDSDVPEWKETCIGVWSRSKKDHQANENSNDRICYGISVVRVSKHVDLKKVMVNKIKTRGIQVIIQEKDGNPVPPPKPHDHSYISVERIEPEEIDTQKHENGDPNNPANEDMSLTRRVIDVMMMKKANLESSVEQYKNEGIKLEDVWNGLCNSCSKYYKTTVRLLSYCHPVDKAGQVYGFAAKRIRNASRRWLGGGDDEK